MLANYLQPSVFNSLFVISILTSPTLPGLLADLRYQLERNYTLMVQAFEDWGIEFLPTHAGFHVFARLAKNAKNWDDEASVAKQLLDSGVMVGPGKGFGGIDGEVGWFRLSFSIPQEKLKTGLKRIEKILGLPNHMQ